MVAEINDDSEAAGGKYLPPAADRARVRDFACCA